MSDVNFDLVIRFQTMTKNIVDRRNAVRDGQIQTSDTDIKPWEILMKKPRISLLREYFTRGSMYQKGAINIPAGNDMLVKQAARALAQVQSWAVVGNHLHSDTDGVEYPQVRSTNPVNQVKYGKVMQHKVTGQLIAAVVVENSTAMHPVDICEVYKFDHAKERWAFHPIVNYVRNGTVKETGAFIWNMRLKEHCPAYTKYNLLAVMLLGYKIHIHTEDEAALNESPWFEVFIDAFRRELWSKICGYGWQIQNAYWGMWSDVSSQFQTMREDGWTEEEIKELLEAKQ